MCIYIYIYTCFESVLKVCSYCFTIFNVCYLFENDKKTPTVTENDPLGDSTGPWVLRNPLGTPQGPPAIPWGGCPPSDPLVLGSRPKV